MEPTDLDLLRLFCLITRINLGSYNFNLVSELFVPDCVLNSLQNMKTKVIRDTITKGVEMLVLKPKGTTGTDVEMPEDKLG